MEKKIEDFAAEKFKFELPEVLVLPSFLNLSVRTDTGAVGSFKLRYKDDVKYQNRKIRGYITCNDYRFKFDLLTFSNNEVEVDYEFEGRGLEAGQEYNGNINLITDCGEINIPYYISIKEAGIITGNDEINNIYQFISLAKNDFGQAVKIFYSDEFEKFILKDKEEEIQVLTQNLEDYKQKRFGAETGDYITQRWRLVQPIQDQVFNITQEIAKTRKFDYILTSEDAAAIYADEKNDISKVVLRLLKRKDNAEDRNKEISTLLKENLGVDYKTEKQRKQEKAKNEAQKVKNETKTEARKVRNERAR